MRHLTSEQLIDLAEGLRPESSTPHLQSCETCREKLVELRTTISAVASMQVPEPSPLFWDHFSARVHAAVEAEGTTGTPAGGRWSWLRVSPLRVVTFAFVVLAIVIVTRGGRSGMPVSAPDGSPVAVGEPLGGALPGSMPGGSMPGSMSGSMIATDDPSLSLVADLAAGLDLDAAFEAGLTTYIGADSDAVTDLTDGERGVLRRLLKGELAHRGA